MIIRSKHHLQYTVINNFLFVVLLAFLLILIISCNRNSINIIEKSNFYIRYDLNIESVMYDIEHLKQYMEHLKLYYEFPDKYRKYAALISEEELYKQIKSAQDFLENEAYTNTSFAGNATELRKIILEGLNIEFLLKDINKKNSS